MAIAERQPAADLVDTVLCSAHSYSFFSLVERLHGLHDDNLEAARLTAPARRRLRLECDPRLGFPVAEVTIAERLLYQHAPEHSRYRVNVTLFGMHGTDSPLPGYFLDRLAYEHAQETGIRTAFLDFFNHYLLGLLHRSWRKYRYYIRFRPHAQDQFSRYVFALIGLETPQLRGATALPWSRLLSFAGLIAGRSRAPGIVAGIIAHCFELQHVNIRQFEPRVVDICSRQRVMLGRQNGVLGNSFVAGQRTRTRSSKFTIVISQLTQARMREFLPDGENFERLRALIDFLLRDALAYDLELCLQPDEIPPFSIDRGQATQLGWTSFLGTADNHRGVRIKVRS